MSENETRPVQPALLWEGRAAMFAGPDGSRVIRYEVDGRDEFVALPASLVPALEMLRANPAALLNIENSPMGAMARRAAARFAKQAAGS